MLSPEQSAIIAAIDDDAVVSFLADLVNIPSPTGHELAAAEYVAEYGQRLGMEVKLQRFSDDRANALLTVRGSGTGPTLMLNGHLDTSYTGTEPELTGIGYKNSATVVDGDWMYGNGVHNMKSALASFVGACAAALTSGVQLTGDVVVACVAGEIEKAPYGRFSGDDYEGFGAGTAYALAHGLTADMCILGEPTANTFGLSNLGVNWLRIRTHGTMAHTQHAATATNAIDHMQTVYAAIQDWIPEYQRAAEYRGLTPAVDITAVEGGWPYRVSRTAVFCDLFLCVRTPPGLSGSAVLRDVRGVLRALNREHPAVRAEADLYVSHLGSVIDESEPVVRSLIAAHEGVTGEALVEHPRGAYMDSSVLNSHGIPTVVYGPSGRVNRPQAADAGWSPSEGEHTYLPDVLTHARTIGAVIGDLCIRTAEEVGAQTVSSFGATRR